MHRLAQLTCAALLGCSAGPVEVTGPTEYAPVDAGISPAFLTENEIAVDGGAVVVDDVTYRSGTLVIHGIVCRPASSSARPLVMLNHGGFMGIDPMTRSQCIGFAQLGLVAGVSSYRGEDSSEGDIEVCLGEVDDVLAMEEVLRAQAYVDPSRVATVGFSHGACIATMLALRDPTLRAAVDFFGPADVSAANDFWQTQLASGEPFCASIGETGCSSLHQYLVSTVKTALEKTPEKFAERSPATSLATLSVPIMTFQGTYDYAIDLSQACAKRSILHPRAYYLDASFNVNGASSVCGGGFETAPLPTTFPDRAYLFVYEGQGHGFTQPAMDSAGKLAMGFLLSRLE